MGTSGKKCLECNGCCDIIYRENRRFFHCEFCDIYYDIIDNKLTKIDVDETMRLYTEILMQQQREKDKLNERF